MTTYSEEKHALAVEHRRGEADALVKVLERITTIRLENDEHAQRAPTERAYRKGWNESLGDLERWIRTLHERKDNGKIS